MKRLLPLLLCLFLLCGCGFSAAGRDTFGNLGLSGSSAAPYQPDSDTERMTGGAVKVYSLPEDAETRLMSVGGKVLIACTETDAVRFRRLDGSSTYTYAPGSQSSVFYGSGDLLTCYSESSREFCFLDSNLQEISRLSAPDNAEGPAFFSEVQGCIYYAAGNTVRVMDVKTGNSRILKEFSRSGIRLSGLFYRDSILQVTGNGAFAGALLISTADGISCYQSDSCPLLKTREDSWFWHHQTEDYDAILFGTGSADPKQLFPHSCSSFLAFLPDAGQAVTYEESSGKQSITLHLYDLDSGNCLANLTLNGYSAPSEPVADEDGRLLFIARSEASCCNQLLQWDWKKNANTDSTNYVGLYYSESHPDAAGLEACRKRADAMEETYGISLLFNTDAVDIQPWDYSFRPEYRAPVLERELDKVDAILGSFPEQVLNTLTDHYDSVSIGLVSQIRGTPESGSIDTAEGIQYWDGSNAYIVLQTGKQTEYNLCHEFAHLIDTYVIVSCNAFDNWSANNPQGFDYDYSYADYLHREKNEWLEGEGRCFIDSYAMSYPTEDRARILEYAMNPENEAYFQTPAMQEKLRQLSIGIRKAFGLTQSSESFLWEQYLWNSVTWAVSN